MIVPFQVAFMGDLIYHGGRWAARRGMVAAVTPTRAYPRYALEIDAEILAPGGTVPARTKDVSQGGLCVRAAEALRVGEEVDLKLKLVFDAETHSEPLALRARIVWCTRL